MVPNHRATWEEDSRMANEPVPSSREGEALLARLTGPISAIRAPDLDPEKISRRLLVHFQHTVEIRYFTAFYHFAKDLFLSYAQHLIRRFGCPLEARDVAHRLFILLFEKLLAPNEEVPLDYLFPWCYRVILNIVREESRHLKRSRPLDKEAEESLATPSLLDQLIDEEEASLESAKLERILDLLYSSESGLSRRDRSIMRRFYLEGISMKKIAMEMGLSKAHVGVIMMRARRRIARRLEE
jgi:RNA polymerase sigma factor (sigma-70 family)